MDRSERAKLQALSLGWNAHRHHNLECIVNGIDPTGCERIDGWWVVSRHAGGLNGAWVVQSRIRKEFEQLDTDVIKVDNKPWKAEIRVKLKGES